MADEYTEIAQKALDMGLEELYEPIKEGFRPSAEEVKQEAKQLINIARQNKEFDEIYKQSIKNLNPESQSSIFKFTKNHIMSKQHYVEVLRQVIKFQQVVNEFLGQKVFMTLMFVSPKGETVELFNMNSDIENITNVNYNKYHKTFQGKISLAKVREAEETVKMINKQNDSLKNTFTEVWQRYRISRDTYDFKSNGAFILWKAKGKWEGASLHTVGPLGEAYVAFFINDFTFSNRIESSVKTFMTHKDFGAIKADATNGFLQGDITKGALEIGVKMGNNAEPLGYSDIIDFAREIIQVTDVDSYLQHLKEKLQEKGEKQKQVKLLTGNIQNTHKELIDNLIQEGRVGGTYSGKYSNGVSIYE